MRQRLRTQKAAATQCDGDVEEGEDVAGIDGSRGDDEFAAIDRDCPVLLDLVLAGGMHLAVLALDNGRCLLRR